MTRRLLWAFFAISLSLAWTTTAFGQLTEAKMAAVFGPMNARNPLFFLALCLISTVPFLVFLRSNHKATI